MSLEKNESKVLYPKLSYQINGILFLVHKELDTYAREKQYGDLIESKLKENKIEYKRELQIGNTGNILDFLINNQIVLEIKTIRYITDECFRQIQNYLQQTGLDLGILVNFREKYIKPHRVLRDRNLMN